MISTVENNLPTKALLLNLSSEGGTGVLRLARDAKVGPATLIRLLREMKDEGLVRLSEVRSRKAGRPRIRVKVTPLGEDFAGMYRQLTLKLLRSRRADLERAVSDALYADRLASRGLSAYDLFLDMNEVVRVAGRSAV